MKQQYSAEGKVALVTGANKGIGFEVARRLAEKGLTVFLGARDGPAGESGPEYVHHPPGAAA